MHLKIRLFDKFKYAKVLFNNALIFGGGYHIKHVIGSLASLLYLNIRTP